MQHARSTDVMFYRIFNWTDVAVVLTSAINILAICSPDVESHTFVGVSGKPCVEACARCSHLHVLCFAAILRVVRCIRMIQRIEIFRRMLSATRRVLPAITPQMLLFGTTYYSFAVLGQALFAGCVTQVEAHGGPGEWTSEPWSSTMFGQTSYYYNLNFDNLYSSFVTLFMLMIQNNWHVTVNGYVECTGTDYTKLFFLTFNIVTALILINIFVGVVLDMFNLYFNDELNKIGAASESEFVDEGGLFNIVCHRLNSKADTNGKPLSETWEVSHEIDSSILYSGVSPSDAVMLLAEEANRTDLKGVKAMLNHMPMPVYCRTAGECLEVLFMPLILLQATRLPMQM